MPKSSASTEGGTTDTQLTLTTKYPSCWTSEVSEDMKAGALAHTMYHTSHETVKGHYTVYANRLTEISNFVKTARDSRLTNSLTELSSRHKFDQNILERSNTTQEILVEFDPASSITDELLEYGFVSNGPVQIDNGWESRDVVDTGDKEINERLRSLESETGANVVVDKTGAISNISEDISQQQDLLTDRQREVLDLARKHDYYGWPRETTTQELAHELGISKTTLLEHLRKAEAKLLNR